MASESSTCVLHVDDESMFVETVASFFETETDELDIVTETDPQMVPARVSEEPIQCIVSDYDMPGMTGLELLERVREPNPKLPFFLYTGKGSEEIAAQALNTGATGYLQKGGLEQHRRLSSRITHAVEKYQAEQESERYARVLQALDYPLYVVDDQPKFQYVNEAFTRLTGYEYSELIGSQPSLVKTDTGVDQSTEALRTVLSDHGPDTKQFDIEIVSKAGAHIPCQDHLAAETQNGEFRSSVGILRSYRETRLQQKESAQGSEQFEELLSMVTHDIRTPLQTAVTAGALARDTGAEKHFDRLETAHNRIDQITGRLSTLAHEGQSVENPQSVSLGKIARNAWATVTSENKHSLSINTDQSILAEPSSLQRLFENLLSNAIKHGAAREQQVDAHTHKTTPVTVTVGDRPDGFYVADDGAGMSETVRNQAFESGFTTVADGMGLGLSIVSRIATAHDWDISIQESATCGTRFEFVGITRRRE